MLKKILGISLLVVVIGVLVFGAVNRTLAKSASEGVEQSGYGRGSAQTVASAEQTGEAHNQEYLGQGGRGAGGYGAGESNNLMNGSYNHLQAFVSTLKTQTGETYQPQYLSAEAYQAIINTGGETGGNSRGGGRGNSNRGNRP
jgi:hypothetical protein